MGAMEVAVKQLQPGVTEAEKIRFLQEAAINGQFRQPECRAADGSSDHRRTCELVGTQSE